MHDLDLVLTLGGALGAALVFGLVSQRLRLSPIVGYLLAGVAVGPFTPGFVADRGLAAQLAEIGVILLMFGVGLHFHVKELLAVRRVAIPGALVQIAVATGLGAIVAHAAGWTLGAGVVLGLAVSVASTVVLLRVLSDRDVLHTPAGHLTVGWCLVEDVFTVLALVLLPIAAGPRESGAAGIALRAGVALAKVAGLVVAMLVAGRWLIPKILAHVARTRSRELFTLAVLALALGVAIAAAEVFGASMALGAFLAGIVVGQSDFGSRAASDALPMRDAFAVLFFVAMGMLLDPHQLAANAWLIGGLLAVVLVGKPLAAFVVVRLLGKPTKTALTVGLALAQIGEFSFILAALAIELGVLPARATQVLVATAIASITASPLLFRLVGPLTRLLADAGAPADVAPERADADPLVVVVGHGPVGATLTRLLREHGIEPSVVELDHEVAARLRRAGVRAVYGDASQRAILEQAGLGRAHALVFTPSGSPVDVVRAAKELRPDIAVLARTPYLHETRVLEKAGATRVVTAEGEVAIAMGEHLLRDLGASDEQIDAARERVRAEVAARAA